MQSGETWHGLGKRNISTSSETGNEGKFKRVARFGRPRTNSPFPHVREKVTTKQFAFPEVKERAGTDIHTRNNSLNKMPTDAKP